jgi:hypothetical protein
MAGIVEIMPGVMIALVLIYMVAMAAMKAYDDGAPKIPWQLPAIMSLFHFVWSVYAMVVEPIFGFWAEHTRNFWGNQIAFDLFFGVAIGWTLILPRARAVDMNIALWLLLVAATANIALLAMLARMLYLEDKMKFQYSSVN